MTSLDPKLVQRAKDLAARDSVQVYMEVLQREMRKALLSKAAGDEAAAREVLVVVEGVHVHEAVVMDEHGTAMLIRAGWEIVTDPKSIADVVGRSRMEGRA